MTAPRVHYLSHGYPTGYGVAGFRLVEALLEAGVTVRWTPIDFSPTSPAFPDHRRGHPRLDHHRDLAGPVDVVVLHAIPEVLPAVLGGDLPVVCHTVWETDRLQDHWPDLLNRCAGVLVPTEWNAEVFRSSGVTVPIEVVPHVRDDLAAPTDTSWLDDLGDRFVVYSIAAWEPRKTPWRSLEAYARAFDPDDDTVVYVLKSGRQHQAPDARFQGPGSRHRDTSWALAMALRELGRTPPIVLDDRVLTDAQIRGLHRRGDCWLSLPHAEGWDLGAFDAATFGTPVITTGWGAPLEYLDPSASRLVPIEEVPVHVPPAPPDPTMRWAEPDLDAAVGALQELRARPRPHRRRAERQARELQARYAPEAVAATTLAALHRILG
ncbi:MAG: hypothetical protein ACO1PW_09980 [Actinomycetota bacterium]